MKVNFSILFLFFISQLIFCQNELQIKGKVICEKIAVQDVEVINLVSEKSTLTNDNGDFLILAKPNDMLVFVSKNYEYKRLFLDQEVIKKNNIVTVLTKKPEELEEVIVKKFNAPEIKFNQAAADQAYLEKVAQTAKVSGVYDGTITNGADINRILGMVWRLFIKPSKKNY